MSWFSFGGGAIATTTSGGAGSTVSRTRVTGPLKIDGITYTNVQVFEVKGGIVYLDGKALDGKDPTTGEKVIYKSLQIIVEGDVTGSIKTTSGDVSVGGSCQSTSSVSGNIRVEGDIQGSASSVSEDVSASGGIGGSTSTVSGRINGAKKK